MKTKLKITPVEENKIYKIYIEKYFLDDIHPETNEAITALPLNYKDYKCFACDGEPAFSLTKCEAQDLVYALTNLLGDKDKTN